MIEVTIITIIILMVVNMLCKDFFLEFPEILTIIDGILLIIAVQALKTNVDPISSLMLNDISIMIVIMIPLVLGYKYMQKMSSK